MIVALLMFTLCYFVSYRLAKFSYNENKAFECLTCDQIYSKKMPFISVFLMACLCTYFNYVVTNNSTEYGSDRLNYLTSFDYGRFETPGLMFIMALVQKYGGDFNCVLYVSTFLSVFIVMLAYRYSRDATPITLMLFFMSPFVFQTFTALKQCYTTSLATLLIMLLIQKKSIIKEFFCILIIILSCLFHSAGYLLIIIYLLFRINIKITNLSKVFIYSALVILFFKPILLLISTLVSGFFPYLSQKILDYFGEEGMDADGGIIVILKGVPYYYILFIAIKYKSYLQSKIKDYDKYLLITVIGSFFYLATVYNVWMRRATDLLVFAILVFWTLIVKHIPKSRDRMITEIILMLIFTYRWLIMIYINFGFF